jgi:hypothetical protein
MSLRSNSPWTSTSRPSSSCARIAVSISRRMNASYCSGVQLPDRRRSRARRTSAVWGNDPIVVVGQRGRRSRSR